MSFSSWRLKKILSYFWSQDLETIESELSGQLTVAMENGKMVLNSASTNYSYGSLQRVFEIALRKRPTEVAKVRDVLILGMGGGCLVELLRRQPGFKARITALEKDPVILSLAEKHFSEAFTAVNLIREDAVVYVKQCLEDYDLILVDLFLDREAAPGSLTPEFIGDLACLLRPGGTIYHNLMLEPPGPQRVLNTYNECFNNAVMLQIMAVNQVIVASA